MTHSQSYTDKLEAAKQYLKDRGIDVTDRNCKFRPTASHDTDIRPLRPVRISVSVARLIGLPLALNCVAGLTPTLL